MSELCYRCSIDKECPYCAHKIYLNDEELSKGVHINPTKININKILKRYGLEQYDSYELLKRGGAKLPIDNLQFIDPILNFSQEFKKSFYLAGVRHYLGCNGDNCCEAVKIVPGEEIKFVWEADNLYDKNAVQVYDQREKLIGYVPRYYAEAFAAFIKEKRVKKGKILCVDKNRNCDECIKIEVSVAGV